jgi:3-deoxy-D-manno-octulosonic acid kinase
MSLLRWQEGEGAMLYDPRRMHQPEAALFDTAYWRAAGALTPADRGRGGAWFLRPAMVGSIDASAGEPEEWVLRHYKRGGLVARWNPDRYLWTGEEATRPFRELRMTYALQAAGLPVPVPVAARYQRAGLHYRADLLTVRIPGVKTLSARLAEWPVAVWTAVGSCLRRLHAAGAWHADLNAHNVLVGLPDGAPPSVHVIDWDRGRLQAGPLGAGPARGNLLRLQRSLHKLALEAGWRSAESAAAWAALEAAYAAG